MKKFFLCVILIFQILNLDAQTKKEYLIIPCKSGTLFIDGISMGLIEANDVSKQSISIGEHYFQLKNGIDKNNFTLIIDETTKNIIKIGCDAPVRTNSIRLIDKQISLTGLLSDDLEENIFGLDKDDEIIINSSVINKKGTASIFIIEVNKGNEIYRKQDFKILENEKIKISEKGIYKIGLYTDALFGKEAKISIDRVPSNSSKLNFNTNPRIIFDTTFSEIVKTVARVYSSGNLEHTNRTALSINLPVNTSYWTYWIGVDQEAQDGMKNFIGSLSSTASAFSLNPLVLFGMKLIPSLPMMNTTATVDYKFMDTPNANEFVSGNAYKYYTFKHSDNVSTDYSLFTSRASDLVLALTNNSTFTGYNVEVRVVAFIVKSKFALED